MPQAEEELRQIMDMLFHNGGINDAEPYQFLISRGYVERDGLFTHPDKQHFVTEKEWLCLRFMRDEWDYWWE